MWGWGSGAAAGMRPGPPTHHPLPHLALPRPTPNPIQPHLPLHPRCTRTPFSCAPALPLLLRSRPPALPPSRPHTPHAFPGLTLACLLLRLPALSIHVPAHEHVHESHLYLQPTPRPCPGQRAQSQLQHHVPFHANGLHLRPKLHAKPLLADALCTGLQPTPRLCAWCASWTPRCGARSTRLSAAAPTSLI